VLVGAGMLMKFAPWDVIVDHISALESAHPTTRHDTSRLLPPGNR